MLTIEQVVIIGLLASVLVQALKLGFSYFQMPLDKSWITIAVALISIVLAWIFEPQVIPIYVGEPLAYLADWLGVLGAVLGFSMAVYNLLLDKVFDMLGLYSERFEQLGNK